MNVLSEFTDAYQRFSSYPLNVVGKGTYHYASESRHSRLQELAPKLFTRDSKNVDVRFRDPARDGSAFERGQIADDCQLKSQLGDLSIQDPQTSRVTGNMVTKRDPTCRFILLSGGHSRNALRITYEMFSRIMSYHQVMPEYLDFVSVFGVQEKPRDIRFGGFRSSTSLEQAQTSLAIPFLGRSGRTFRLCYNLKAPERNLSDLGKWSIRQAAIFHHFDVETGTALWLLTKGELEPLRSRINYLTGPKGRPEDRSFSKPEDCFRSSIAVVLLLCHWSTEDWRWYIISLEDTFDREVSKPTLTRNSSAQTDMIQ